LKQNKLSDAEILSKRALLIFAQEASQTAKQGNIGDDDLNIAITTTTLNLVRIDVANKKYANAEEKLKQNISFLSMLYGESPSLVGTLEEYGKLLRLLKRPIEAARVEKRVQRLKQQ
jgi:hypothetical protein